MTPYYQLPAFEQALYAVHAAVAMARNAKGALVSVRPSDVLLLYYHGVVRRRMSYIKKLRGSMRPAELTLAKWWLQRLADAVGGVERPTKYVGYRVILPVKVLLAMGPVEIAVKLVEEA